MHGGRLIGTMGFVLVVCAGCSSQPRGPGPMAAVAYPPGRPMARAVDMNATASVEPMAEDMPRSGARRRAVASGEYDGVGGGSVGGDLAQDDSDARPPRPNQIVAVRGGSIMAESPAEQAARKRQVAAMMKDVNPPRVDFGLTTGTTPKAATP